MQVYRDLLACVSLAMLATAPGCGSSEPVSWRVAMVRDYREPFIASIRWASTLLPPTVHTVPLATVSQRNQGVIHGLWAASNEDVYATSEWKSWDPESDQFIRVYSRDGRMLGEYKGLAEDRYVTSPVILEKDKSAVFVTGHGRIMIGAPPGYTFTACPQRLPVDYKVFPESAKIYEIDRGHVVFGMELYSGPVYRINLRDGSSEEIARKACLLGTYQRMPVVSVHEDDRTVRIQVLGGAFPTKGTMMWDGLGGYYTDMVNRTSPCGEYYLYDAARLSGFRLRIAKIGPHGAQSTLSSLGRITSVGSWWAGAALTTQPSSIAQ